jgi:hypothetical protein
MLFTEFSETERVVAHMEQRAFERYDSDALVSCRYFNGGNPIEGDMINYSENGMCFKSRTPFIEKSVVLVKIDLNNGNHSDTPIPEAARSICVGEIKWCREIATDSSPYYKTGLAYYHF